MTLSSPSPLHESIGPQMGILRYQMGILSQIQLRWFTCQA